MSDQPFMTLEQAEALLMGEQLGTPSPNPDHQTRSALAHARLLLAAEMNREADAQHREDHAAYNAERMQGIKVGLDASNDPDMW